MGNTAYISMHVYTPERSSATEMAERLEALDLWDFEADVYNELQALKPRLDATWKGHNIGPDDVCEILQPLADEFGVTFVVYYADDYGPESHFWVGQDALKEEVKDKLGQRDELNAFLEQHADLVRQIITERNS